MSDQPGLNKFGAARHDGCENCGATTTRGVDELYCPKCIEQSKNRLARKPASVNCTVLDSNASVDEALAEMMKGKGIGIEIVHPEFTECTLPRVESKKKPWKAQIVNTVWIDVIVMAETKEEAESELEKGNYTEEEEVKHEYDQTTWGPQLVEPVEHQRQDRVSGDGVESS